MKKLFIVIVIFVCLISGCSCKQDYEKTSIYSSSVRGYLTASDLDYTVVDPFGTYLNIVGYDEEKVLGVEEEFNELTSKYHGLLDRNYYYRDEKGVLINNLKVINDSYGSGDSVIVDDILIEILKEGIKYTKLSNGKFNIFVGSLVDLWDERFSFLSPLYKVDPSDNEVSEAMKCVLKVSDIDETFIIDEVNKSVTFKKFGECSEGASITFGALGKSFFLDKLVGEESFKDIGPSIFNAGQSSIIVMGDNPIRSGGDWHVAIKNSYNDDNYLAQLKIDGGLAVSTSSGDEKGYVNNENVFRHHILDGTSGYPNTYVLSATVVGESAMVMDVVTTTLMTLTNLEEVKAFLNLLGEDISVLLQVMEGDTFKVYINESMKNIVLDNYSLMEFEEFSYGA